MSLEPGVCCGTQGRVPLCCPESACDDGGSHCVSKHFTQKANEVDHSSEH